MSLAGAVLLTLVLPASTAELKAKPGGKIRIDYGAAQWQEAWEERIFDGMIWRLSTGNANRAVIEPALIFDDAVVFPGTYNLGLANRGPDEWGLVFHNDGLNWNAGPCEAETRFERVWLDEKEAARALKIDLGAGQEGYVWTVEIGPRRLTKPFRTSKTTAEKGKVGKHAFTMTVLEREDLDRVREELDEDEVVVARVESKALSGPARAHLRGGETAELAIWPAEDFRAPLFLDGQKGKAQRPSKAVSLSIQNGREFAVLDFTIGEDRYTFDLPPKLFEKRDLEAPEDG